MLGLQSAQRTDDNSPAIHRWVTSTKRNLKPAERAADIGGTKRERNVRLSLASRALRFLSVLFPSTKVLGYYRSSASRTKNAMRRPAMASRLLLTVFLVVVCACHRPNASTLKPLKPP